MKKVLIVGGGFAGINVAKTLGKLADVEVTVVDRRNHHLFQPLLYQVAMAGLSPADIAAPIRSMLSRFRNTRVLQGELKSLQLADGRVTTDIGELPFDYLVLACGAQHSYFGRDEWEEFAPGLKTLEQATEIRRRVLAAFEQAESTQDHEFRRRLLTFVVVGGGPTGVELAGAIGEMTRFTLAKDFRNIDAKLARIVLIEAGDRILSMFSSEQSSRAVRDLENLGVQVWVNSRVTNIDSTGVNVGRERIDSSTVLWGAGVESSPVGKLTGSELDPQGRVVVQSDLSLLGHPNVFVAGDMARVVNATGKPLPGIAPVAMQQGVHIGRLIRSEIQSKTSSASRAPFKYYDKGQMATIGRSRAIVETGGYHFKGRFAWLIWLIVHIYYLTGFRNRMLVVMQWAWSYFSFRRGARLILSKEWRTHSNSLAKHS